MGGRGRGGEQGGCLLNEKGWEEEVEAVNKKAAYSMRKAWRKG